MPLHYFWKIILKSINTYKCIYVSQPAYSVYILYKCAKCQRARRYLCIDVFKARSIIDHSSIILPIILLIQITDHSITRAYFDEFSAFPLSSLFFYFQRRFWYLLSLFFGNLCVFIFLNSFVIKLLYGDFKKVTLLFYLKIYCMRN